MQKIDQYIQALTRASENGNLVFFVGAGVSRISEYPQWWELVNKFHIGLYGDTKDGGYSSDEYLKIPQIFHDVEGKEAYDAILEETFKVEKPTNPIHDKILAMNPVHIITTNYDELIDKACSQRGRYFSVISADKDVANATSPRYLLKVHGDFRRGYKGEYVVLKESDYMNYEQNYPLISNLMKTIMATHTIVFIGYGLGDYNINSLLNWVRQLQKDGYNKPFFIRVDHEPIEEKTAMYYESKGLRIIDAASIVETSKNDFIQRYEKVLDKLIDTKNKTFLVNDNDVVDYIYKKLSPLFVLQSVRKLDLKHVFEFDYHFEVNGTVFRNKNKGMGYMERFFELKEEEKNNLSECSRGKFDTISAFLDHNGIYCMSNNVHTKTINTSFNIESPAYHSDYNEMKRIIQLPSSDLEGEYKKAFFLACLGRWEEAYIIYSDLLLKSIKESKWWIHYLSQINRFRLYQSIKQANQHLSNTGLLVYGHHIKPFSDEFLKRIDREMKNFNIDNVFGGMPYEFQEKYIILEFLSDNKFLYDDTVKLFELTNKVRSDISKGSFSIGSKTPTLEIQLRLNDNIRFMYENGLWSTFFIEFKQYIRNSLMLQFEKGEYEQTRDIDDFGHFMGLGITEFYIDYYDFVNVAKSFSIDDIKHIERSCKIERFKLQDIEAIEKYLMRITDGIIKYSLKDEVDVVFYNQVISEVKVAFYFARYLKLSEEVLIKIINALLFYIPEKDADIGTRYLWIDRLTRESGLPNAAIVIIEDFLIRQANKHYDSNFQEKSKNNLFSLNFCNLILHFDKKFVSSELSDYAMGLNESMANQINFMYRLSSILSNEAKDYLFNLKKVHGIHELMESIQTGAVDNISEHQDIITDFMDKRSSKILADKSNGVITGYAENYFVQFGIWYFLGELTDPKMNDYLGFDEEYDMFVNPEAFDYKKFRPIWLKKYHDELLKKIAENEYMRPHIIEILKERIKNTNDKNYIDIFIDYFI